MARPIRRWYQFAFLLALLGCISATTSGQATRFGSDGVPESAEALKPREPRTAQENDRLVAAAEYSYGRLLLQRDETARALRHLERAFRWDPQATFIVREIVPSAGSLGRHAEAVRYAILAAEQDAGDPKLLRPLGEILVQQGDFARAITLFDLALRHNDSADKGTAVLLKAELARLNLLTGKAERAAELFTDVQTALADLDKAGITGESKRQLLEQRSRVYPLMGETYVQVKRYDDARAMFRKWHEVEANEPRLWVQLARVAVEEKDWKSSRELLSKYFSAKSTVAGTLPYELLSKSFVGEWGASEDTNAKLLAELKKIYEQDRNNTILGLFLANKLETAGKREEAAKAYSDLNAAEPSLVAWRGLARIYRADHNAAAIWKLLPTAFAEGGTRELLGEEGAAIANDAELLKQLIELARTTDPQKEMLSYTAPVSVALLAIKAKQFGVVDELCEKALSYPNADASKIRESLGLATLFEEQHALAAKILSGAVDEKGSKEKRAAYNFYLAGALEMSGRHDEALAAAEKCAQLDPTSAQFSSRPAWILYHAKKLDESEKRYRAILAKFDSKYDQEETRDQMRQTRLILSNIAVMQKRLPDAEEWLEQVLDEFPEDIGAQNDLGYLWADQAKHLGRALTMCQKAVKAEPENGAYRDSLGWAHYRLGQFAEAVQELEKAAQLTPEAVIFDHLGDAYLQAKQTEKAVDAWQKALASFTAEQESEKIQQTKAKLDQYEK